MNNVTSYSSKALGGMVYETISDAGGTLRVIVRANGTRTLYYSGGSKFLPHGWGKVAQKQMDEIIAAA